MAISTWIGCSPTFTTINIYSFRPICGCGRCTKHEAGFIASQCNRPIIARWPLTWPEVCSNSMGSGEARETAPPAVTSTAGVTAGQCDFRKKFNVIFQHICIVLFLYYGLSLSVSVCCVFLTLDLREPVRLVIMLGWYRECVQEHQQNHQPIEDGGFHHSSALPATKPVPATPAAAETGCDWTALWVTHTEHAHLHS